jgi:hypothetical protein
MRVFALCASSFVESARQASGVEPLASPPLTAADFDPALLAGHDFIYLDLHGGPDDPHWYGDAGPAVTAEQLRQAQLGGAVVFATNCDLGDAVSPMLDALLAAGASCVIAGAGTNYAGTTQATDAAALGQNFRAQLELGLHPVAALERAKRQTGLQALLRGEFLLRGGLRDIVKTLEFRAFVPAAKVAPAVIPEPEPAAPTPAPDAVAGVAAVIEALEPEPGPSAVPADEAGAASHGPAAG